MDKYNYDSYCGIYCGACDILQSYKTGQTLPLASFWNIDNVKVYQKKIGNSSANINSLSYECHGCKSDLVFINCKPCRIRKCAIQKNIEHCIDCSDYPCEFISVFQKAEKILPHLKTNPSNLETIKKVGVKQWLLEQENRWQCQICQSPSSWYMKKCKKCGTSLKGKSLVLSFIQKSILKISIHLIPNQK